MGRIYPVAKFDDIGPGDVLITSCERAEFLVYSTHEAVPERKIPPEIVTTITRADPGSGLCGMTGVTYIMDGRLIHDLRVKKKGEPQ